MKLYELTDKLTDQMNFEFDNAKKLGHMRCQYGNTKQIANQFVRQDDLSAKCSLHKIDLKRIQEIVNVMQFDWIENYERLEMYCRGKEYDKVETNYFLQDGNVNYWIRLNPFGTSEYNMYIHIYHA
jgi:hypothetical protein